MKAGQKSSRARYASLIEIQKFVTPSEITQAPNLAARTPRSDKLATADSGEEAGLSESSRMVRNFKVYGPFLQRHGTLDHVAWYS